PWKSQTTSRATMLPQHRKHRHSTALSTIETCLEERMSDPDTEVLNQPTPPKISDAGLAEYRRLLADQSFATDYPERYAALRDSVTEALAATGQSLQPIPDPNTTEAQRLHDRRWGVTFD